MPMEKKECLRSVGIFSSLGDRELDLVADNSEFRIFNPGDVIFPQGERGGAMYVVAIGTVQAMKNNGGSDILVAELVGGDLLGELEFFTGGNYNATVRAVTETTLLRIPAEGSDFTELFESHPEVASLILYEFLRVFSSRLRKANSLVKDNSALVQELKRQVYGDKLTGLYNKTYLEETLPGYLVNRNSPTGLLLMKPDNFKMINDTFGHEAGDETLKIMAGALNRFMGERGTVLRYMGNELGVILPGCDRDAVSREADAIRRMFNELDISAATGNRDVYLSISIGAAVFPGHADVADDLIARAHELPLAGRERGGNMILFPEDLND